MNKELICINCPQGCPLQIEHDEKNIIAVAGNKCKRGITYAEHEIFNPVRMVTTTMRIDGASIPQIPIKTQSPVPRECTMGVIEQASKVRLTAPVKVGEVVLANVLNTGVDLLATRSLGEVVTA